MEMENNYVKVIDWLMKKETQTNLAINLGLMTGSTTLTMMDLKTPIHSEINSLTRTDSKILRVKNSMMD
jgi:uncharacterized membrane protein